MGTVRIQTVCGFGCGSSLFLKMKIEEILSKVPVVTIGSFVNKKEVTQKTLEYFESLEK